MKMPHTGAQFGPLEPGDDFGTGYPVDPDVAPSTAGIMLTVVLRGAGLEEDDIARAGLELPTFETNEAIAELGIEQEAVFGALGPPAVDASAHIGVFGIEWTDRRGWGLLIGEHGTILYVFDRGVYSLAEGKAIRCVA